MTAQFPIAYVSNPYVLVVNPVLGGRGASVAQASRNLEVHENVLRKWVKEFAVDPGQAFPGHGQMKPEQLEIERLRREVAVTFHLNPGTAVQHFQHVAPAGNLIIGI